LDGGGVDDEVLDAVVLEVAMEPEAIAAGLVAGDDRRFLGQAEPAPSGRAARISQIRASVSRAGMERSLGFCPAPTVKASFQVV